MAEMNTLSNRA